MDDDDDDDDNDNNHGSAKDKHFDGWTSEWTKCRTDGRTDGRLLGIDREGEEEIKTRRKTKPIVHSPARLTNPGRPIKVVDVVCPQFVSVQIRRVA